MRPFVALCKPSGGHPHWKFQNSVERMLFEALRAGIDVIPINKRGAIIEHNRNLCVNEVLEKHPAVTHILFVDDDQVFPANTIQEMLRADKDIMTAQVFYKEPPFSPITCVMDPQGLLVPVYLDPLKNNVVKKVSATGAGCLMIKRRVFETLAFPWFSVHYDLEENLPIGIRGLQKGTAIRGHLLIGEDTWFCAQAQAAGFDIYCHFGLVIAHIDQGREITYKDHEDYERNKSDNQDQG